MSETLNPQPLRPAKNELPNRPDEAVEALIDEDEDDETSDSIRGFFQAESNSSRESNLVVEPIAAEPIPPLQDTDTRRPHLVRGRRRQQDVSRFSSRTVDASIQSPTRVKSDRVPVEQDAGRDSDRATVIQLQMLETEIAALQKELGSFSNRLFGFFSGERKKKQALLEEKKAMHRIAEESLHQKKTPASEDALPELDDDHIVALDGEEYTDDDTTEEDAVAIESAVSVQSTPDPATQERNQLIVERADLEQEIRQVQADIERYERMTKTEGTVDVMATLQQLKNQEDELLDQAEELLKKESAVVKTVDVRPVADTETLITDFFARVSKEVQQRMPSSTNVSIEPQREISYNKQKRTAEEIFIDVLQANKETPVQDLRQMQTIYSGLSHKGISANRTLVNIITKEALRLLEEQPDIAAAILKETTDEDMQEQQLAAK